MRNIQKKQQQIEKREQIQASWELIVQAKNYAMHKIIQAGKKMGMFRYLMLAVLFVFLFTFHFCYHLCLQLKMKEKMAMAISLAMTVILIFTSVNITAFAAISDEETGGETVKTITAFQTLEEEVAQQTLAPGDTENDIYFPENITVRFVVTESADESVETEESQPDAEKSQESEFVSEESRQEEKKETEPPANEPEKSVEESEKEEQTPSTEESPELEEQEVSLTVTWKLDTENSTGEIFNSTEEGNIYVYMPVLPEEYMLAEEISLHRITVTIGGKATWQKLQEQIDALPTVEEFMSMTEGSFAEGTVFTQQQFEIYETIMEIMDAYELLSEEEQQKIDITRLQELMEYINSMTDVTAAGTGQYEAISIAAASLNGNAIRGVTEDSYAASMDDYAHFYSESISSEGGLPNNGKITMPVSQVPYYLATGEDQSKAYDGNDCIRLTASDTSATMNLETIGVYQSVYVLATAGGPGTGHYADFKVTLHYTDGTTDNTEYKLYDWYDLTPISGVENYYDVKRINNGSSSPDGTTETSGGPVLHSAAIKVNPGKLLKAITFTMNGKDGNSSAMSGLYCCVFAITGATPEGVPEKPIATPATKQEGDTSGVFTANWKPVSGATGYVIDVAKNRNFTQILSSYNNKSVGDVTSYKVEGNEISPDVTYYYRVRAVNDKGQSLSSNRIATDLPIWIKNALNETDYDKISYDAEANTVTVKSDITLKKTLVIPEQDTTTIDLKGNNILAPEGKSAISAGGKDTKLSIVSTGEKGSIKANGTDSDGNGIAAIDFSNADGESTISVSNNDVIGSNGKDATEKENGGAGGAGIKGSSATTVDAGSNATIKGGNGGNAQTGTGGNGDSGIEGGKATVSGAASIAGGNGGNASFGTGGNGGTGVNGTVSSSGSGNVSGGNGGNGAAAAGAGGSAGTSGGTQGADGSIHIHQWKYSAEGNVIKAVCVNTKNSCNYATESLKLKLNVATPVAFSGQPYANAKVDDGISALTGAAVGKILYYKTDSEGNKIDQKIPAPSETGNYLAEVTLTDGKQSATATAPFSIVDRDLPTGGIRIGNMTWNSFTENPTFQMFFKITDAVTITAADAGSGIDKIYYYLSEKVLTQNQVEQLGDENWTVYENPFSLKKDGDFVLYVKLTDKSGNKAYLSSGGLSIDGTAPEIAGVKNKGSY